MYSAGAATVSHLLEIFTPSCWCQTGPTPPRGAAVQPLQTFLVRGGMGLDCGLRDPVCLPSADIPRPSQGQWGSTLHFPAPASHPHLATDWPTGPAPLPQSSGCMGTG